MSEPTKASEPKSYGSGSGTQRVYVVEARSIYHEPQTHHGMLLDARWRRLYFPQSPIGVVTRLYNAEAESHGFMTYQAATALAHWFMCDSQNEREYGTCVQTRLVEIEFQSSFSAKEVGVGPTLSMFEQRREFKSAPREQVTEGGSTR